MATSFANHPKYNIMSFSQKLSNCPHSDKYFETWYLSRIKFVQSCCLFSNCYKSNHLFLFLTNRVNIDQNLFLVYLYNSIDPVFLVKMKHRIILFSLHVKIWNYACSMKCTSFWMPKDFYSYLQVSQISFRKVFLCLNVNRFNVATHNAI